MFVSIRAIAFLLLCGIIAMAVHGHRDSRMLGIAATTNAARLSPSSLSLSLLFPSTTTNRMETAKISPLICSLMKLRGGEDDESGDEEETDDELDDDNEEDGASTSSLDYAAVLEKVTDATKTNILPVVKKCITTAKNASVSIYQAMYRAIQAGLEGEEDDEESGSDDELDDDDEEEEEVTTVMDKIITISKKSVKVIQRMVKAALTVPEDEGSEELEDNEEDEDDEIVDLDDVIVESAEVEVEEKEDDASTGSETVVDEPAATTTISSSSSSSAAAADVNDFGSYLAEAYSVDDKRNGEKTSGPIILGGSFQDALQTARQQARMLLVFIPSERPKGERGVGLSTFFGKKNTESSDENDEVAIESLLSKEVRKAANKKARKKQGGDNDLGSFAIWGCKAGSSEATSAIKRLKVKATSAKGEKRPILCVVYPAFAAGSDKMVPKVLAQHHCNPPLKAESMASWMNALRKRHGKQYQSMQTDLNELQLYQERKEGYKGSVQSDNERKLKEAQEAAAQKAKEIKEAARQAEIDARRQELQQSLPEDVKTGNNVKKIALRFPDGRSGQRGFESDQPLSVVFNWVDAMFEIERETVVLTTLNGKQTFSWNGDDDTTTLEDAGLNKMTAFRVSESTTEEEE